MKRTVSLSWLMALFVGAAVAADGSVASRVIPNNLTGTTSVNDSGVVARTTTNRTTVSRGTDSASRTTTGRTTANRSTTSRGTDSSARTTTRDVTSRTATTSRGTVSRAGTGTAKTTVSRVATGDINANPAVRRAGVTLRPSFADYGGRATIAGTGTQTGSNIRSDIQKLSGRAAKNTLGTREAIQETKEKLEMAAELNKSCQDQYNECMDQFCAVVDANQKRCSCSSNLSKYAKVEKAVTEANTKLNDVAQAIRYVGLSADEIRAIMSETEAEEALKKTRDTSATRNMLTQIESMIKNPTSNSSTYVSENEFGLDMDLTFSSDPIDIFNLDFLSLGSNSSSISNMRGAELYNTAKKRCKTILTQCEEVGATQTQIIGNYDLAIDHDCIAYEDGLKKMNATLLSNVKSANLMLQKARLAVLQDKNQYDALGCVAALENCMKDDMVCGEDYLQCVDPTKAYIDENGEVVLGQDITVIQSFMTKYNNAEINRDFLADAYGTTISPNKCKGDGKCVVKYLLQKIGTKQKVTDEGMCRAVLDKCQAYTYNDGKYQPYNDIVVNYIQRAMINVKAAQQRIISDYASSCVAEVATCYNQQVTQVTSWASYASKSDIKSVMRGACRSVALTCGLAIFTGEPQIEKNVTLVIEDKNYTVSDCKYITDDSYTYGSAKYNSAIIDCISDMFYASLLCDENDTDCYEQYAGGGSSGGSGDSGGGSGDSGDSGGGTTIYTISYNCNGGSGSIASQTCNSGTTVNLAAVSGCGTKNGNNPTGWNGGATQTACSGNRTFTAQWPSSSDSGGGTTTYTISYNCNGGSGSIASQTCASGTTVNLAAVSGCGTKNGNSPTGWNGGATQTTCSGNRTFTAQWPSSGGGGGGTTTYTISYNCNGGSGSIASQTCTSGTTVNLAAVSGCGTKNGNSPTGWNDGATQTACSGNRTFTAQWPSSGGETTCNADTEVQASECTAGNVGQNGCVSTGCKCKENYVLENGQCVPAGQSLTTHTITYVCNDNAGTTQSVSCNDGLIINDPVMETVCREKTGCAPNGWNTVYENPCDSDKTINADWSCSGTTYYTIQYICDDDGNNTATQQCPENGSARIDKIASQVCGRKAGYIVKGWDTESPIQCTRPIITVNAEWDRLYNITYDCNGGDSSVSNESCRAGSTVDVTDVSGCGKRSGFNLTGWDYEGPTYECNGDKTFTAQWEPKSGSELLKYTITYECVGGDGDIDKTTQLCTENESTPLVDVSGCGINSGYNLVGWIDGFGNHNVQNYTCVGDTTFWAEWSQMCDPASERYNSNCTNSNVGTGLGGCVRENCACNSVRVPSNGQCVDPCGGNVDNAYASSDCPTGTESNCLAKYCVCGPNYEPNNDRTQCVPISNCPSHSDVPYATADKCSSTDADYVDGGCVTNTCRCENGYYTLDGECRQQPSDSDYAPGQDACGSGPDADGTWEGCVLKNYKCNSDTVVGVDNDNNPACVDPCKDVDNYAALIMTADRTCSRTTSGDSGCVAQYCRCNLGYAPEGNACVAQIYQLCYDCGNGASGSVPGCELISPTGTMYPVLATPSCTKDGYDFTGWECEGENYDPGEAADFYGKDVTCNAVWSQSTVQCPEHQVKSSQCGGGAVTEPTEEGCVSTTCACAEGYVAEPVSGPIPVNGPAAVCRKPCAGVAGITTIDMSCTGVCMPGDETCDRACAGPYCACDAGYIVELDSANNPICVEDDSGF